jgi:membrane protein implicated in regulation of membrane protease activity
MNRIVLALVALVALPRAALASGFYLPWWGEALLFLMLTPGGWACTALALVGLVGLLVYALRRRKGRP